MNKKMLCAALLAGLGLAQAATAQEFDDRWYVFAGGHYLNTDDARGIEGEFGYQLGAGKFVSPNWSVDLELFSTNPQDKGAASELNWSLYGAGLIGRYHWMNTDRGWWPYVSVGLGAIRHEDEFSDPLGGRPLEREGTNLFASAGVGLHADLNDRFGMRAEVTYRADFDDAPIVDEDWFGDTLYQLSLVVKLGDLPEPAPEPVAPPPPPPPPAVTPCEQLDDDGDGVNNCVDQCPNSQAGQAVGPDGCPVPLTIDLRGVNFDFDKATLRPDAVAILDEAISILSRYPELRVEVAGHTDAIGTDAYNQKLSEARARTVYDYLTSRGISADRLAGPVGYGEARPIAPNTNPDGSDNPEGRALNRRTELNVDN